MFKNKQLNLILNELLKNNKDAKKYFSAFVSSLPEPVIDIIYECQSIEHVGDDYEVNAYFSPNCIQIEIYYNNAYFRIDLCPIRTRQLKDIPLDQEHDIFLDDDKGLDSPAYFNIVYNPDVDLYETSLETPDIGYFIVKQHEKDGSVGYHLISQSLDDAGIHNTKINIADFIIDDPNEQYKEQLEEECLQDEQPEPEQNDFARKSSRRAPHPRCF